MATTLPAAWYGDAAVHGRERARIFGTSWQFLTFAGRLREPGDYVADDIAGWNVVVVVDDDGRLRGHHNVCRHRAGPIVATGAGRVPSLVCRYHGWAYGLDGGLRSARDFGGELDCTTVSLAPVRVETWRGLVFVNIDLDGDAPSLLDDLGGFVAACAGFPLESFEAAIGKQFTIECNWKVYADNYLEGYHIPLVHPGLNKEIDAKQYRVEVHDDGRWIEQHAPARDGAVNLGRWLWRWPNLALNLYPHGLNVERYDPLGPRRTRLRYSYAVRPDTNGDPDTEARDDIVRVSSAVTEEDIAICEAVQRNLDSGVYREGLLSPRHENGVARFQSWVRAAVG